MSSRALILAVVVLLIVSSMALLGASNARAAPVSTAPRAGPAHPAVSSLQMETTSGRCYDCNTSYYTTGSEGGEEQYLGDNILYFAFYDPAGDHFVNFTLTDTNATRDGVSQPAFHAEVPINNMTGFYYSSEAGVSYTFPASLKIGGNWTVSGSAPLAGNVSYHIWVGTFTVFTAGTPSPDSIVLPGESITTSFEAISWSNGAPDGSVTNVAYNGEYLGANDNSTNLIPTGIVSQASGPLGSYTWTVPANATYDEWIILDIWVTIQVNGKVTENVSSVAEYLVGEVSIDVFWLNTGDYGGPCTREAYQYDFTSGSYIQACAIVGASAEDGFSAVPGLTVGISFWNGAKNVTPPGGVPTSLVTNASGEISFSFWAFTPQFSSWYQAPFYNSVNLTVKNPSAHPVPAGPYNRTWYNYSFYMEASSASVGVSVTLNQLTFFPGQTITATWTLSSTNSTQSGPTSAVAWMLWSSATEDLISQGTISSTATTGTIPVTLPTGFIGSFYLEVYATNATTRFYGYVYGVVQAPTLALNPASETFTPGQSVTVTAEAWGDGSIGTAVITYEIYAYYEQGEASYGGGGLVTTGTVANDSSFTINVPATGAPSYYEILAFLGSSSAGTVATAELELDQAWGYSVLLGVNTQSSYADGSFQPGQTITLSYQISPYGDAPLPVLYTFYVYVYSTQIGSEIQTTSRSGTFQFTIPSNEPSGTIWVELELYGTYLEGNSCGGGYCYGETALTINANPSELEKELSPGAGFTVGSLILLVIIILVAIIGVLAWIVHRRRVHPPSGGSGGAPVTTPMTPPAPAPSSPGATEWQAPPPASDGQPPLPTPPPGAT